MRTPKRLIALAAAAAAVAAVVAASPPEAIDPSLDLARTAATDTADVLDALFEETVDRLEALTRGYDAYGPFLTTPAPEADEPEREPSPQTWFESALEYLFRGDNVDAADNYYDGADDELDDDGPHAQEADLADDLHRAAAALRPPAWARLLRFWEPSRPSHALKTLQPPPEWVAAGRPPRLDRARPPRAAMEVLGAAPQIDDDDSAAVAANKCVATLALLGTEARHEPSLALLADMLLFGYYDMAVHPDLALELYQTLADSFSSVHAHYMLGFLHAMGLAGAAPPDTSRAQAHFAVAALANHTGATLTLGYRHLVGIGGPASCANAAPYYRAAAKAALRAFRDGPPLGRHLLPRKTALPDWIDGGVFGPGASYGERPRPYGAGGGPRGRRVGRRSGPGSSSGGDAGTAERDVLLYYQYTASRDDPIAQYLLGLHYYHEGVHRPALYHTAQQYFERAAGHLERAQRIPSVFDAPQREVRDGLNLAPVRSSRVQASVQAMGYLGVMAWRGEGAPQNNDTARHWLERAAHFGDGAALNALGIMWRDGGVSQYNGGVPHANRALALFLRASEADYPDGHVNVAASHFSRGDFAAALKFYAHALRHAHPEAQYMFGLMTLRGLGTPPNCRLAVMHFKSLAEQNDWPDQIYDRALAEFVDGNVDRALLNLLLAAERGYECAQTSVAWLLDQQLVRPADSAVFLSGSVAGDGSLTSSIAHAATSDPFALALVYWTRAAIQGNPDARVKVGDYWYYGLGTELSHDAAELAALLRHSRSGRVDGDDISGPADDPTLYERFQRTMGIIPPPTGPRSPARAAALYAVAANYEQSSIAHWNLGCLYARGIGVPRDYHLARRCFDSAAERSPVAYLATKLALLDLWCRYVWALLTRQPTSADTPVGPETEKAEAGLPESKGDFVESAVVVFFCALVAMLLWYRGQLRQAAHNNALRQHRRAAEEAATRAEPAPASRVPDSQELASGPDSQETPTTPVRIPRRSSSLSLSRADSAALRAALALAPSDDGIDDAPRDGGLRHRRGRPHSVSGSVSSSASGDSLVGLVPEEPEPAAGAESPHSTDHTA